MVAISERVKQDIVKYYQCPAPIHVIHHGVDLDLFSPCNKTRWRSAVRAQYGIGDDETVFLFVGDLRKGANRCIRALAEMNAGRLLLVSRTPVDGFRRIAEQAGVTDRVTFAGPTNQVERAYAAADALVLPTPYDAFAMVVSEAMASGLPVILSREAGASELIEHGVNGLRLEDVTSVAELAGHMNFLMQDQRRAAEIGCAARRSVEPMSWDAIARKTMRVYQEFLASKPL